MPFGLCPQWASLLRFLPLLASLSSLGMPVSKRLALAFLSTPQIVQRWKAVSLAFLYMGLMLEV